MQTDPMNQTRTHALQQMDTAKRRVKLAIVPVASLETVLLATFVYVMDFGSRQD